MKNLKKGLFIVPILLLTIVVFSFTKSDVAPPAPETSISVEDAKLHRSLFIENNKTDHSDFTFDYEQMKKFMDHVEYQKSKGEDVSSIRVYVSQYENGKVTAFIAPIKKDDSPNFNIQPMNYGGSRRPPISY